MSKQTCVKIYPSLRGISDFPKNYFLLKSFISAHGYIGFHFYFVLSQKRTLIKSINKIYTWAICKHNISTFNILTNANQIRIMWIIRSGLNQTIARFWWSSRAAKCELKFIPITKQADSLSDYRMQHQDYSLPILQSAPLNSISFN